MWPSQKTWTFIKNSLKDDVLPKTLFPLIVPCKNLLNLDFRRNYLIKEFRNLCFLNNHAYKKKILWKSNIRLVFNFDKFRDTIFSLLSSTCGERELWFPRDNDQWTHLKLNRGPKIIQFSPLSSRSVHTCFRSYIYGEKTRWRNELCAPRELL